MSGIISGTGGLTKTGTGALTLSGADTFTGAVNVSNGVVIAQDSAALGSTARLVRWTPDADLRGQMERERNGTELWLPLALAAIGLVVVETLLGNRFSRSK